MVLRLLFFIFLQAVLFGSLFTGSALAVVSVPEPTSTSSQACEIPVYPNNYKVQWVRPNWVSIFTTDKSNVIDWYTGVLEGAGWTLEKSEKTHFAADDTQQCEAAPLDCYGWYATFKKGNQTFYLRVTCKGGVYFVDESNPGSGLCARVDYKWISAQCYTGPAERETTPSNLCVREKFGADYYYCGADCEGETFADETQCQKEANEKNATVRKELERTGRLKRDCSGYLDGWARAVCASGLLPERPGPDKLCEKYSGYPRALCDVGGFEVNPVTFLPQGDAEPEPDIIAEAQKSKNPEDVFMRRLREMGYESDFYSGDAEGQTLAGTIGTLGLQVDTRIPKERGSLDLLTSRGGGLNIVELITRDTLTLGYLFGLGDITNTPLESTSSKYGREMIEWIIDPSNPIIQEGRLITPNDLMVVGLEQSNGNIFEAFDRVHTALEVTYRLIPSSDVAKEVNARLLDIRGDGFDKGGSLYHFFGTAEAAYRDPNGYFGITNVDKLIVKKESTKGNLERSSLDPQKPDYMEMVIDLEGADYGRQLAEAFPPKKSLELIISDIGYPLRAIPNNLRTVYGALLDISLAGIKMKIKGDDIGTFQEIYKDSDNIIYREIFSSPLLGD